MDSSKQEERLTAEFRESYLDRQPEKRKWYQTYPINCGTVMDMIIIIASCTASMVLVDRGILPHAKQGFYCGDPTINHCFNGDSVSTFQLALVTLVAPLVFMITIECTRSRFTRDGASWSKIFSWYKGVLICLSCFLTFTTGLKAVAGEPRPHFLDTCAPDAAQNCTTGEYITAYKCLKSHGDHDHSILDAYMSFPSGHAGLATAVSVYCTVYILKRFNTVQLGIVLKAVLSSLVLAWGFMVSLTRIVDHRHHWWDVLAGIVIGIALAICCIKYHCDLFEIPEKETRGNNTMCSMHICRRSKIVSRCLSSRELLAATDKDTTCVNM